MVSKKEPKGIYEKAYWKYIDFCIGFFVFLIIVFFTGFSILTFAFSMVMIIIAVKKERNYIMKGMFWGLVALFVLLLLLAGACFIGLSGL